MSHIMSLLVVLSAKYAFSLLVFWSNPCIPWEASLVMSHIFLYPSLTHPWVD